MSLARKISKIEIKAEALAKERENELNYKTFIESNKDIPKIPIESFFNTKTLFNYELNYLHPLKDFTFNIIGDEKKIFAQKHNYLYLLNCLEEVHSIYHLTMPKQTNEKNQYLFFQNNKYASINFTKDITHLKNQEKLDSFMLNIIPKIHRQLADMDYLCDPIIIVDIRNKKRILSIDLQLKNTFNNIKTS